MGPGSAILFFHAPGPLLDPFLAAQCSAAKIFQKKGLATRPILFSRSWTLSWPLSGPDPKAGQQEGSRTPLCGPDPSKRGSSSWTLFWLLSGLDPSKRAQVRRMSSVFKLLDHFFVPQPRYFKKGFGSPSPDNKDGSKKVSTEAEEERRRREEKRN